jgi:hypothetical protein
MSSQSQTNFRPVSLTDRGDETVAVVSAWTGVLREFRNHLSDIAATANDLHADLPAGLADRLDDALAETRRSVDALTALVALTEASLQADRPVICDLGGVLERAVQLAVPAVSQQASVVVERGERAGIKNRGSMLECLLAILVVDLAQARAEDGAQSPRVILRAESTRGSLSIEIEIEGVAPAAARTKESLESWRLALAHQLAGKLGARIFPQLEDATYVVQFR